MKPKILITYRIPREGIRELEEKYDVIYPEKEEFTPADIEERIVDCDAVLSVFIRPVTAELMARAPKLKIIANFGVGYNNIDVAEATRRGIAVCNTPNAVTEPTAEMALGLMLTVMRRISETDRNLRSNPDFQWGMMRNLGSGLTEKTLGIIGMGRIGRALARRAVASGMNIIYNNRHRLDETLEKPLNATFVSMDELLERSDVISVNTPLTEETRHLLSEKEMQKMKEGVFVVNTARGPVIDEKMLVKYLQNGKIAGAGLDVFEEEPKITKELFEMENVVLTPHNATGTIETRIETAREASQNIIGFFSGRKDISIVNPEIF
jgi:D-3-phosphoglycerate dehydrogenase